jgi:futalosine hydrolase
MPKHLILVPTNFEYSKLVLESFSTDGCQIAVCGFGPVQSIVETAALLANGQFERVTLIGIAGTYDETQLPIGSATFFDSVCVTDIGAGQGTEFQSAAELGWPSVASKMGSETAGEILPLTSPMGPTNHRLLTVCSASGNQWVANERAMQYQAVAEDMEGFAVALLCRKFGIACSILRGISNLAGDRHHSRWQITPALEAVIELLSNTDLP